MIKFRDGLSLDLNFEKTTIFTSENKIIDKHGNIYSFSNFFNEAVGHFHASEGDFNLLVSVFLSSLYSQSVEPLFDCLSNYVRCVGLIKDKRYFYINFTYTEPFEKVTIKNPPFEYLYGDYLTGRINPDFIREVEKICCSHFIYMNCGALSALVTSSFGTGNCISDSAEKVFSDVIKKPQSVISVLNSSFLDILRDEFVPILSHKVDDPKKIATYLLEKYGENYLKNLWSRLIKKRLPAFIYQKDPDFLNKIFDLRFDSIRREKYENFIEDDLGLRFSLYYSNTSDFRDNYNRMIIKFFHGSNQKWILR